MRQLRRSLHRLQQVRRTCRAAHGSARCTACGNGSTSAQPAQPVSLPGVTGLIQPGMALPTLPKQQAAPAPAPVPAAQPAAVPAMEAAPAAPKSANARDAAMAEVIRRTLKSFQ